MLHNKIISKTALIFTVCSIWEPSIAAPSAQGTACIQSALKKAPQDIQREVLDVLESYQQLVLVVGENWNSKNATVRVWEKSNKTGSKNWLPNGDWRNAVLGNNGLAWGHKFQWSQKKGDPIKKEGDQRTPSGLHVLGPKFGFDFTASTPTSKYITLTPSTECVDDPKSKHYNHIVDSARIKKDWNSSEKMRSIPLYKLGIEVTYQSSAQAQAGSCIFFHLWRNAQTGTAGCIAMNERDISDLHRVLETEKSAVLILPQSELSSWLPCLPGIDAPAFADNINHE